jgi:formate hydrogenlyase subunit 3/multisubunit Na+/H+ antiporter MnhD subunit
MTFPEKSALTMTAILIMVFGGYFAIVLGVISSSPDRDVAYTGLMVGVAVILTILATTSHVLLALVFRSQANAYDERDRLVALRSERIAGYVLALGVCAGIGLAMAQVDTFWIAQVLIGALVAAEVLDGIVKLVLYRRSA